MRRTLWLSFLLFLVIITSTLAPAQEHVSDLPPNPPGQMVDIGGYRMHLYCVGNGSPSVILLNGAGDIFSDWALVQPDIARFTRVCGYDYAWEGFSDAGPVPITMRQQVFESHLMLQNARISPPYILVGHSSGGMVAQLYTMTYPAEVAGLVLVDSLHQDNVMGTSMFRSRATGKVVPPPQTLKTSPPPPPTPEEQRRFDERIKQSHAGNPSPVGPPLSKLPPEALRLREWVHAHPRLLTGEQSDPMIWMPEELQQIHDWRQRKAHPFGHMPIVVIGVLRDNPVSLVERRRQLDDMASLSTNGKVLIDNNSGHHVQWDDPKFVVEAVNEDYEAARAVEMPRSAPLLWGDLQPGRYNVGFRVLYYHDQTRRWLPAESRLDPAGGEKGRPIRISLWYPAVTDGKTAPMTYGDYFHYEGNDDFGELNNELEKIDRGSWLADLNDISSRGNEIFAKLCAIPVAAVRDASPAHGRFPIVFYSGGLGSRSDANVELGEYLASHGYIVATVPQLGLSARELTLETPAEEAGVHVEDLEFAWKVLQGLPSVDVRHLAIVGHSAGGVAALQFAAHNPSVRVVVGLDGSYGVVPEERRAQEWMKVLSGLRLNHVKVSLLDIRRANGVQGAKLDSTVVQRMATSDRYVVTLVKMFHGDFTGFGTIGLKLSLPLPPNNDGRTRETGFLGNQHTYRAVLHFLDAKLQGEPRALDLFLTEIAHTDGAVLVHKPPSAPLEHNPRGRANFERPVEKGH